VAHTTCTVAFCGRWISSDYILRMSTRHLFWMQRHRPSLPDMPLEVKTGALTTPKAPVTYVAVTTTTLPTSAEQPGDDMQGELHISIERVVESMEHTMDTPAHGPKHCTSPMDSPQSADLREPNTTQNRRTGATDGSQHPTVLEVNR
jgi:hypothetical protein